MDPLVILQVVSWNSEKYLSDCLDSLKSQVTPGYRTKIVLLDNASSDSSLNIADSKLESENVLKLTKNLGFTGAHNLGITNALNEGADYVCLINPDLFLEESAIFELLEATKIGPKIGASTPLLLRDKNSKDQICDAAGMLLYDNFRHLDRGSNTPLNDEYKIPSYVFGGTGACLLLTKEAILDISYPKHLDENWTSSKLFDPDFFAYREDAELSFRLQLKGWRVRYEPRANGYHIRQVIPENRSATSPILNGLSVRNRFLIQGNAIPLAFFILNLPNWLIRNLIVVVACLIKERSSLPYLKELWNLRSNILRKRSWNLDGRNTGSLTLSTVIEGNNRSKEIALIKDDSEHSEHRVHAVIVAYFSSTELATNLESVLRALNGLESSKVSLINNSPEDTEFESTCEYLLEISKKYPQVQLEITTSTSNLGFGGAANKALLNSKYDFYLVLNSDISLDGFQVTNLLSDFNNYSNLVAVSPLILDKESNEIQYQYLARRFPRCRDLVFDLFKIFSNTFKERLETHRSYKDHQTLAKLIIEKESHLVEVEQVSGACMLLKASYFNTLGGFNTSFFPAWYEDVDLCKRISNHRLVSAISNSTSVLHLGGESLHSLHSGKFYSIFLANKMKYFRLHQKGYFKKNISMLLIFLDFSLKRLYIALKDYRTRSISSNASIVLNDFKTFISSQRTTI